MAPRTSLAVLWWLGACGPEPTVACVEEAWRVDLPDALGVPCDVAVAADGTILVLTTGRTFEGLLEISPDGELLRTIPFPPSSGRTIDRHCATLATSDDGRRWAIVVETLTDDDHRGRVYVDEGERGLVEAPIFAPPGATWSPIDLATTNRDLFVSGTVRGPDEDVFEGAAFVGLLDRDALTLEVLAMPPGLHSTMQLVPGAGDMLYVLASPPSIDYRDVELVAVDRKRASVSWQREVGSTGQPTKPLVLGAVAARDGGVWVASFENEALVLEEIEANGETGWRIDHPLVDRGFAGDLAATSQHLVAVVQAAAPPLAPSSPPPAQAVVVRDDGTPRCDATLTLPEGRVHVAAHPRHARVAVVVDVPGSAATPLVALDLADESP